LVFESNIDGEIPAYFNRLSAVVQARDGGSFITELFGHCRGYTGNDTRALVRYWQDRVVMPQAGYVAGGGLTRDQIRLDAAIYGVVDQVLASGTPVKPATQMQSAVLAALDT
jgi:hypothetical protein